LTCFGSGGRVMLFTGGPCTSGPGSVVGIPFSMTEQMRSFNDIDKGRAIYMAKASKFYEALAARVVNNAHCVDIFCGGFDQAGLLEMSDLVQKTGGYMYITEEFDSECFRLASIFFFVFFLKNKYFHLVFLLSMYYGWLVH
jgi:protein transport protein SEC23